MAYVNDVEFNQAKKNTTLGVSIVPHEYFP